MQAVILYQLTWLAAALSLGHHLDYLVRHNAVGWPLTDQVNAFTASLVIYPVIATGLLAYRAGRVGPASGPWCRAAVRDPAFQASSSGRGGPPWPPACWMRRPWPGSRWEDLPVSPDRHAALDPAGGQPSHRNAQASPQTRKGPELAFQIVSPVSGRIPHPSGASRHPRQKGDNQPWRATRHSP